MAIDADVVSHKDQVRLVSGRNESERAADGAARSGSSRIMWFLCGRIADSEPVRYIPVHSSPFTIGRRATCGLYLTCKTVSSAHAELYDSGASLLLRDLGSTNGTYVNGKRVTSEVELGPGDLIQVGTQAFRVMQQSSVPSTTTACEDVCDQAMALVLFDRLMTERMVIPHYQPIVDLHDHSIVGLEVLCRSRLTGLETPGQMFSAAAQLDLEARLSQMIRWKAAQETMGLAQVPHLFMNTHPVELDQEGLIESVRMLRSMNSAQSFTLEIHEKAITNPEHMKELREQLKEVDVRVAFDDFGSGQARLVELATVHPDYLKFDISLVQGIGRAGRGQQQMVSHLVKMAQDLGILTLAEGLETEEDVDTCIALGFDLGQGFYLGKPVPLGSL